MDFFGFLILDLIIPFVKNVYAIFHPEIHVHKTALSGMSFSKGVDKLVVRDLVSEVKSRWNIITGPYEYCRFAMNARDPSNTGITYQFFEHHRAMRENKKFFWLKDYYVAMNDFRGLL